MITDTQEQTEQPKQSPINFEPAFTKEQVFKLEDEYNTTWGVNRRIMMSVLSKSSDEMDGIVESIISEDDAGEDFFIMLKWISDYEQHLKHGIELAQSATKRLFLAAEHVAGNKVEPV